MGRSWETQGRWPTFSQRTYILGIKGEAWYRLSELTEIEGVWTAKQLFVSKGRKVTDRCLPGQCAIKAGSSRVQGHLSTAHQQGRHPRHNNVPGPFFLSLKMQWVWSSEYNSFALHCTQPWMTQRKTEWMDVLWSTKMGTNFYSHSSRMPQL